MQFRELALSTYSKCAVTGEEFIGVLEACHIQPYIDERSNHIQNSLILRVDIHELFDSGYITIDENYTVHVSPLLKSESYKMLDGKKIFLPKNKEHYPSKTALNYNNSLFKNSI